MVWAQHYWNVVLRVADLGNFTTAEEACAQNHLRGVGKEGWRWVQNSEKTNTALISRRNEPDNRWYVLTYKGANVRWSWVLTLPPSSLWTSHLSLFSSSDRKNFAYLAGGP